jgi:predicted naringenin-chalcone synthase
VVNTITGLAIPSLDAMLMNRLDFPRKMERLPIFGLGCGGGVAGLSRAARFAAFAFALPIQVLRCSCPLPCSATERRASC